MTSYQNKYSGEGWNDCMPHLITKPSAGSRTSSSGSMASNGLRKVSSKVIITQADLPPPPVSRTVSGSSTSGTLNSGSSTSGDDSSIVIIEDAGKIPSSCDTYIPSDLSVEDVQKVLGQVLSRPSSLPAKELNHYTSRLQKTVTALEQVHLDMVYQACQTVLEQQDVPKARQTVVQHSLVYSGLSSWILPLRKVIESVN